MEFQYSDIIDSAKYETKGLCGDIPLRMHKDFMKEYIGAIRAQEDWNKLVGPAKHYRGGLGAEYSFIGVTVPECLPERFEIISYANEFAFLYDDVMENINPDQNAHGDRQILDVFREEAQNGGTASKDLGEKKIQMQILSEMVAIDPERALTTMKSWATFIQLAASRPRSMPFATLDEYLPYRIIDAGEMLWFGTVTFAMALTIPENELDLCKQLARPAFAALSLANDLFSWEKEYDASKRNGDPHVVNAIWVIMQEHSVTELTAKSMCQVKLKEVVAEYVRIVEDSKKNFNLSLDLRKYLEALQYSVSGNLVWSLYCPRYHSGASYNALQLAMMERGSLNGLKSYREGNSGTKGSVDFTV